MKIKFTRMLEADTGAGVNGADNTSNADTTTTDTQDTSNTDQATEKTFTQADVDKMIKDRLAREKKGQPTKEELKAFKEWQDNQKTQEEKNAEKITQAETKVKEAEQRAALAEIKVACLSKGVKADSVDDVVTLAKAMVDDHTTIDKAIDKVLKKYPSFKNEEQQNNNGFRIGGKGNSSDNKAEQDKLMAAFGVKK